MICKNCNKEIPDNSNFCTGCGAPVEHMQAPQPFVPQQKNNSTKKTLIIAGVAVFLAVII
ncbi:MAG: zinc-ribbon domain-containing protein, partial [Clostridia bacterium]|nr:zinc-ribbon domain-containing protein [Clostridia bacterium]